MLRRQEKTLEILLFLAICLSALSWFSVRHIQAEWTNVPPVRSKISAVGSALGDSQLAYRMIGTMLQNLGDTGGRTTPLRDYDFGPLAEWFLLTYDLDPQSSAAPYLAAYYYGAVDKPEKLPPLLEYLSTVGQDPSGKHWRWLAQAVYLARYQLKDTDLALKYAKVLAEMGRENPDMPIWTQEMPAFVLKARGDKQEALDVMIQILKSNVDNIDPAEVFQTRYYICTELLDPEEALRNPLCEGVKE